MSAPSDESEADAETTEPDASDWIRVELRFYAPFKESVGEKSVPLELARGSTLGDAIARAVEEYPALEGKLLDDAGRIRDGVRALHNGRASADAETRLADGDDVSLTTPIHGG